MKTMLLSIAVMAMLGFSGPGDLLGRWETKPSEKGNVTGLNFKADSSYDGYVNKKPFVSGTYTLKDGVLSFVENSCNGERGIYKVIFFSNSDSMRWELIKDSCTPRREGIRKLVFGRVK